MNNGTIVYLHDQNDPEREVPQFLNMIPENANGVVLLTGMGLCYTPMAILEQRKTIQYLAVFDLMPDIFLQALRHMDLSSMLSDPRLILSIDSEPDIDKVLAPASLALQLESIYDLKHMPSFALDKERYTTLSDAVFTVANQFNLGGGAILGGGRAYTANRFKNLTSMYKNCMVEDLKGKFKDIPAILFEDLIVSNPGVYINSTVKGARIKGTEAMALEDVIAEYYPSEKKVSAIIASSISYDKNSEKCIKEFRAFLRKSKTLVNNPYPKGIGA